MITRSRVPGWIVLPFSALRVRDFRFLWLGGAGGQLAYWVQIVAYGWLAFELTQSAAFLGAVSAATAIPALLFMLPSGVVADRWNRRSLMVWSQALFAVNGGILTVLVMTNTVEPWQVAVSAGANGLLASINLPARQSLFPHQVGRTLVANALALLGLSFNAARVVGPAVAGLLIGWVGLTGSFVFLTLSQALATWALLAMGPEPARAGMAGERTILRNLGDALLYVVRDPVVRWLMILATCQNAFGVTFIYLLPAFAGEVYNIGGTGLGVLQSAIGIGSTVGAAFATALGHRAVNRSVLVWTALLFAAGVVAFAASSSLPLALTVLLVVGPLLTFTMFVNQTMLTLRTPDELRGRVWSIHMMTWSLPLLATLPAGWAADLVGAPWTVGVLGLVLLAITGVAAMWSQPLRKLDHEPRPA